MGHDCCSLARFQPRAVQPLHPNHRHRTAGRPQGGAVDLPGIVAGQAAGLDQPFAQGPGSAFGRDPLGRGPCRAARFFLEGALGSDLGGEAGAHLGALGFGQSTGLGLIGLGIQFRGGGKRHQRQCSAQSDRAHLGGLAAAGGHHRQRRCFGGQRRAVRAPLGPTAQRLGQCPIARDFCRDAGPLLGRDLRGQGLVRCAGPRRDLPGGRQQSDRQGRQRFSEPPRHCPPSRGGR
jgi:hypothetical protein